MKKAKQISDLHIHSKYSKHPSDWILQKLGTGESYTEPELIYKKCMESGMNYVTITDHNTIDGIKSLMEKYPETTFSGVETTAYFPEDGCKIHILFYGFSDAQFERINELRTNIYKLRDYIMTEKIAYSVAHAADPVNGKLTTAHIEKLILLFDVFESINGARVPFCNKTLTEILGNLTPDKIGELRAKHNIEPISDTPWIKGFTGGSDDHGDLLAAATFTECECSSLPEYLDAIRNKKSTASGRHNNFYSLAFSIYKVAYDFSKTKNFGFYQYIFNTFNEMIFEKKSHKFKTLLFMGHLKSKYKKRNEDTINIISEIIDKIVLNQKTPIDDKITVLYESLTKLSDQFFGATIKSVLKDVKKLDIINLSQKFTASLFGVLMTLPFISTLKHINQNRELLLKLKADFLPESNSDGKNVVWFTDTISDLNGVSVTLRKIGWLSHAKGKKLTLVSSLTSEEINNELPPNLHLLDHIYTFTPKDYDAYTFKFPSVLKTLKDIYEMQPDEIIISTPGPVGLIGLLCAKLLNIKSKAIYHTDFTLEFEKILGENSPSQIIEGFMRWFYNANDEILVPTKEYIQILNDRNYDQKKLKIFERGLDLTQYNFKQSGRTFLNEAFGIKENGTVLLFTGRVSKDKNLDFLIDVYNSVSENRKNCYLLIVGDGPYFDDLKKKTKDNKKIKFAGKQKQSVLPFIYSGADIFIFPSYSDTFGMSVLEAQACGLPAVVSDRGGPKEIIVDCKTGFVCKWDSFEEWVSRTNELLNLRDGNFEQFNWMKMNSQENIKIRYNWENILDRII